MTFTRNKFYRILSSVLVLSLLASVAWIQSSISPAAAQEPEPNLSILIVPEGEEFSIASIGIPPVFEVGETFKVSIVALGITDPGLFGSQFEVAYETDYLDAKQSSLSPGSAMEPVVIALSEINSDNGLVEYAASRRGDVENLFGNIVLASFNFEAVGATPEGQTTLIDLGNVKLGTKSGLEVPVSGIVDLEVIIIDSTPPENGDIAGNIKVEGRADDNQAGHSVTLDSLSALTGALGDFLVENVPFGTYNATANSPGFLAATCEGLDHNSDPTTLNSVTLLAGDVAEDGFIDITDAVAIGLALSSADPAADLNADGIVDILDLILMAANYEQTSTGNPWLCQLPAEL